MSKLKRPLRPTQAAKSDKQQPADEKSEPNGGRDSFRETIESIVIAFVLAFLFRTFEAEAFVIPTGSMAPTLMGQHKDLKCPECGFGYRVNASDEVPDEDTERIRDVDRREYALGLKQVAACVCPNCRYPFEFEPGTDEAPKSYKGDRILVSKFPSQLKRWDVAVFKYPENAKQNFIKRIVGVPDETVRIHRGDILVRRGDAADFEIARKPPEKVVAMLQTVYDNDYLLPWIEQRGVPPRWAPLDSAAEDEWQAASDGKSFASRGGGTTMAWLRYSHIVPTQAVWEKLFEGPLEADARSRLRPQLITDFYAYNAGFTVRDVRDLRDRWLELGHLGQNWVGDLAVECELTFGAGQGTVSLELVKGGRLFGCNLDLASGDATLSIDQLDGFRPLARGALAGAGTYQVRLANVDNQLLLWVNDRLVGFDASTAYNDLGNTVPDHRDLAPVGIGVRGAAVEVRHLRVLRDIYYIAIGHRDSAGNLADYSLRGIGPDEAALAAFLSTPDPRSWQRFNELRSLDLPLAEDEYLMLGDNSPRSKDGRSWTSTDDQGRREYYVKRDLLTGKALFVYWPHAWAPDWAVPVRVRGFEVNVPFYPNFGRMRPIR